MTSKLKCPVCKKPLEQVGTSRQYQCGSWGCDASFDMIGTESLWAAWTQAKQDLEIARKALEEISSHYQDEMGKPTFVDWYLSAKKMCDCADKALETIGKHKEQIC